MEEASRSQALQGGLLQGQHSGFLECIDDNFLTQMIEEVMRGAVLLDLILTNKEKLFRNANVGAEFGILKE